MYTCARYSLYARHICTYIYSHIQDAASVHVHTADTYAGAYEYPLRLPAGSEGDSRQLKKWATRESGVKCNFDTKGLALLCYWEVTVEAWEFFRSRGLPRFSRTPFFSLRYEKLERERETKMLFYCISRIKILKSEDIYRIYCDTMINYCTKCPTTRNKVFTSCKCN